MINKKALVHLQSLYGLEEVIHYHLSFSISKMERKKKQVKKKKKKNLALYPKSFIKQS